MPGKPTYGCLHLPPSRVLANPNGEQLPEQPTEESEVANLWHDSKDLFATTYSRHVQGLLRAITGVPHPRIGFKGSANNLSKNKKAAADDSFANGSRQRTSHSIGSPSAKCQPVGQKKGKKFSATLAPGLARVVSHRVFPGFSSHFPRESHLPAEALFSSNPLFVKQKVMQLTKLTLVVELEMWPKLGPINIPGFLFSLVMSGKSLLAVVLGQPRDRQFKLSRLVRVITRDDQTIFPTADRSEEYPGVRQTAAVVVLLDQLVLVAE
jgi:hypothetical protein